MTKLEWQYFCNKKYTIMLIMKWNGILMCSVLEDSMLFYDWRRRTWVFGQSSVGTGRSAWQRLDETYPLGPPENKTPSWEDEVGSSYTTAPSIGTTHRLNRRACVRSLYSVCVCPTNSGLSLMGSEGSSVCEQKWAASTCEAYLIVIEKIELFFK